MDIAEGKKEFLTKIALADSLTSALQRSQTYNKDRKPSDGQKDKFKSFWRKEIIEHAAQYGYAARCNGPISDDDHSKNIEKICASVTYAHKEILHGDKLRVGTSQKAFNLYLKHLWCLSLIPTPPHCPIDRIVLSKILNEEEMKDAKWTELDSIEKYKIWVERIRQEAAKDGYSSIQEWELSVWNQSNRV